MEFCCVVAETGVEQLVKKARTMSTESSMKDAFSTYADYLNNFVSVFFLCSMFVSGFILLERLNLFLYVRFVGLDN